MKIVQLIYTLGSGGAEKFVVDLSNQLAVMGHEVILCMLRDDTDKKLIFNQQFLSDTIKFHSMKFNCGFSLNKAHQVEKYLRRERPDIVHCHLNVIPYIFKMTLFNQKIVFLHTLHNIARNTGGVGVQYYINKLFYGRNMVHPVCISRICQESYKEYYKLHNAPYINNGRTLVAASLCYEEVQREINSYKMSKDTIVFVHVARYSIQKNQQLLVDTFNKLSTEKYDFVLLVIGNGYDTEEGRKLQHLSCEKIYFLGEKNNVNDYLLCSDAFCLTSVYEGLPISLLEALSCGVTPICTSVGGIPDVITDGVNGYLAFELDVEAYAQAVKRFIVCPLSRQMLIGYFMENYSIEVCAKRYEHLYYSIKNT